MGEPRLAPALLIAALASLCVPLLFLYLTRPGCRALGGLSGHRHHGVTGPFFPLYQPALPRSSGSAHHPCRHTGPCALAGAMRLYRSWGPVGSAAARTPGPCSCAACPSSTLRPRSNWTPLRSRRAATRLALPSPPPRPLHRRLGRRRRPLGYRRLQLRLQRDWAGAVLPGNACEKVLSICPPGGSPCQASGYTWKKGSSTARPCTSTPSSACWPSPASGTGRVVVALGTYTATAAIHGLHPMWTFGYGFSCPLPGDGATRCGLGGWRGPCRCCCARQRRHSSWPSPWSSVWKTVLDTLVLTERGYMGHNLLGRSINQYYPLQQHFLPTNQQDMPLLDIALLGAAVGSPVVPAPTSRPALGSRCRGRPRSLLVEPKRRLGPPAATEFVPLYGPPFLCGLRDRTEGIWHGVSPPLEQVRNPSRWQSTSPARWDIPWTDQQHPDGPTPIPVPTC